MGHLLAGLRTIPACAGKTHQAHSLEVLWWDHPRVCGENLACQMSWLIVLGPSPRVRGKRLEWLMREAEAGTIPACAGKTPVFNDGYLASWDHPRVCGENKEPRDGGAKRRGPSPRVRGKHMQGKSRFGGIGTIPACAGKTPSFRRGRR